MTRPCRSFSGCGSSSASGWPSSTGATWASRPATPAARSASTAGRCPRRPPPPWPPSSSGKHTSPSQAAIRAERKVRLQEALNGLDPIDREVLALRHYEQLSNGETATVLGLDKSAASKRYARALVRLKDILAALPGGLERELIR